MFWNKMLGRKIIPPVYNDQKYDQCSKLDFRPRLGSGTNICDLHTPAQEWQAPAATLSTIYLLQLIDLVLKWELYRGKIPCHQFPFIWRKWWLTIAILEQMCFNLFLKTSRLSACRMWSGNVFHRDGNAFLNVLSPYFSLFVFGPVLRRSLDFDLRPYG